MDANERARRYRARKRGESVTKVKPGPKPGFVQSTEHIAKRKRFGSEHPNWVGADVSTAGGRTRAQRTYKEIGPCVLCGAKRSERHHIDGNTANNEAKNIVILCRKCHMREDGRLERFRKLALSNNAKRRKALLR